MPPRNASNIADNDTISAPEAQCPTPRIFAGNPRPSENMTSAIKPGMTDDIRMTVRRSKAGIRLRGRLAT
ncbi:hypothetical protein PTKU46_66550 [Paraburkholderia terrae]